MQEDNSHDEIGSQKDSGTDERTNTFLETRAMPSDLILPPSRSDLLNLSLCYINITTLGDSISNTGNFKGHTQTISEP